jgi:hypothetical protein
MPQINEHKMFLLLIMDSQRKKKKVLCGAMVSNRFRRSALQRGALFKDASKGTMQKDSITTIGVILLNCWSSVPYDMIQWNLSIIRPRRSNQDCTNRSVFTRIQSTGNRMGILSSDACR